MSPTTIHCSKKKRPLRVLWEPRKGTELFPRSLIGVHYKYGHRFALSAKSKGSNASVRA